MKYNKIIKIVSSGVIAIASLLMLIFSIINLANGGESTVATIEPLRIVTCVLLITSSAITAMLSIVDDPHKFDMKQVVSGGLLFGLGIFVALPVFVDVANSVVGYLIPSFITGIGVFFAIATVVSLINKINKRSTDIIGMIIGIIMIVGGALLIAFAEKTTQIIWLVIAVILLISSVLSIVKNIKTKEN